MEQNKEQKWYPVEYSGFWRIQNCEEYDGIDMLNADDVGIGQAERNARLCASAPELLELVNDIGQWMGGYIHERPTKDSTHPIHKLLERIEEIKDRVIQ